MKKISQKSLAVLAIILSFLFSDFAFAEAGTSDKVAQSKASAATTKKVETVADPDLKLSIEELRNKYPIDWLQKKYGNYDDPTCTGATTDDNYILPKNLICSFSETEFAKQPPLKKFSVNEIKSAFVFKPYDFRQKSSTIADPRIVELIGMVLEYFNKKQESVLTNEDMILRDFSYSDKVLNPILNSSSCQDIKRRFKIDPSITCKK